MLPSFVKRRVRWAWLAGLATTVWWNRRDVKRWARFLKRSLASRPGLDWNAFVTEARVRAAVTMDPVLRADPAVDDVRVDNGEVTVLTSSTAWPDAAEHLERLQTLKGVHHVRQTPGLDLGGARVTSDGEPVI